MRLTIRKIQHYIRLFEDAVYDSGWSYALLRTGAFLRHRIGSRLGCGRQQPDTAAISPFDDIVGTLGVPVVPKPLLLIVSDTRIRQCIHYRIQQKIRFLNRIGLRAMHVSPAEAGRLRSFLALSHTVIVYRTQLDEEQLDALRETGARLLFEVDDLVVGRAAVEASGILDQVNETQAAGLLRQAESFLKTAAACDGLILSTTYLAEVYGRPEHGLADKPTMVVPNFVETDDFAAPGAKHETFAFTSPSGSIQTELAMLTAFLHGYEAATDHDWSILVMGNLAAQRHLLVAGFQRGTVRARPFSDFDSYLAAIATAGTVLIPLSDSGFNRAKTPIRLMDAAVAGSQAVFCPVGSYTQIRDALHDPALCVGPDGWAEASGKIAPLLARTTETTADLQQAVRAAFGVEVALACYREVFVDRLGLGSHVVADMGADPAGHQGTAV